MKESIVKIGLLAVLALGSLAGLTACSDQEIALGAGVIIGAAISDDGSYHRHHHDHYYPPARPYPPYPPYPPARRARWEGRLDLPAAAVAAAAVPMTETEKVAAHFDLSDDAAVKVLSALRAAEKQDLSELSALGFDRDDLLAMAKGENPRASTLVKTAEVLGIEFGQAHDVIQQMKEDLVKGLANRN